MKTVPSLVASSTIGVAAAGLALGRQETTTSQQMSSKNPRAGDFTDVARRSEEVSSTPARPATSLTAAVDHGQTPSPLQSKHLDRPQRAHQRPPLSRVEIPNHTGRRYSFSRHFDSPPLREPLHEMGRRESVSSRSSWIKRLSSLSNSYSNSPRSSIGLDSPSLSICQASGVAILSNPAVSPTQSPRNKLVKRVTSARVVSGPESVKGSKLKVPTLRRPATSHQRSMTLQQQFRDESRRNSKELVLDLSPSPFTHTTTHFDKSRTPESRRAWRLYFESRPTKSSRERKSSTLGDENRPRLHKTSKRVILDESVTPALVKPAMIVRIKEYDAAYYEECSLESDGSDDEEIDHGAETTIAPAMPTNQEKRPRRSLSMQFNFSSTWISRAGSLPGPKRSIESRDGTRYTAAPGPYTTSAHGFTNRWRRPLDPTVFQREPVTPVAATSSGNPFAGNYATRNRNSPSPLPTLSHFPSFNIDVARLGLSSASPPVPRRIPKAPVQLTNVTSGSVPSSNNVPVAQSYSCANLRKTRALEFPDHVASLNGSKIGAKRFLSGDEEEEEEGEDDTDFQSETVFDSLRSGATGSMRSHNPPLDSMFEESPPSLNGYAKRKRLSIHQILGNGGHHDHDGKNRIVEEDESMSTPVRKSRLSAEDKFKTPVCPAAMESRLDFDFQLSSSSRLSLATQEIHDSLALDDEEEDKDWEKDDFNVGSTNTLSPPSHLFSSRQAPPTLRAVHTGRTEQKSASRQPRSGSDRPKSNVFDWSEPSPVEVCFPGSSPRPKTAHVKQMMDGRGGRTLGRRGPTAVHVRSQSVPVVPDVDSSKLIPKFGTWGLGAKVISEDWDGDFEFDNVTDKDQSKSTVGNSGMLVPEAIQASQENIAGHVGQIREVCLLVEDLKRLRKLGKQQGLLGGEYAALWTQADGIIALAAPEEEKLLAPNHSPSSPSLVHPDHGHEAGILPPPVEMHSTDFHCLATEADALSCLEAPFDVLNRHGRPTGFIYDGKTVRRRSVFAHEDDIFGAGVISGSPKRESRRLSNVKASPRHSSARSSTDVARKVMESMHQQRSSSDPLLQNLMEEPGSKMPFDTRSLKDLVSRAAVLSRILSDIVREADGFSHSAEPKSSCESSPAFTRVFTDPVASPPKSLPRSQSTNAVIGTSIEASPTRSIGQRMHMMAVV